MNKYKYKYFMNGMIDRMIGFSAITASNRGQGAGPLSGSRVENPGNKR